MMKSLYAPLTLSTGFLAVSILAGCAAPNASKAAPPAEKRRIGYPGLGAAIIKIRSAKNAPLCKRRISRRVAPT